MERDVQGLVDKILSYNPSADVARVQKAYAFADAHHKNQKRASGDPYITHPLAVAHMLAELKLDIPSIITGLLHDTVEDTEASLEDIKSEFGVEISYLVDGVTKLSRIELQSKSHAQAENLRKFVLAMAQDIRVLIIKLMDRLHNMRTISHLPSMDSQKRIALETIEIYAPLAQRIGMFNVQEQLQNLSFAILNPDAYQTILKRIAEFHEKGHDIVKSVIEDLQGILKKGGLVAEVYGREKKPYSIWRKMQWKNINFDQTSDLFAFRVIVGSKKDCYEALGLIHHAKVVIPKTFKDYISTPKPNHYQALHTKVLGPHGARLEIQIRTHHMQEVAERGVAAHWQYKIGSPLEKHGEIPKRDMKNYQWIQSLLDILEQTSGAEEFLEHTKLEMFQDQVFCFTPKGDIINLPNGATVIDFAYALHSEVGNRCKGAKVNGRAVPLKSELHNGDQVEIFTHEEAKPLPEWEQFALTGKAQANIRRFMRAQRRGQFLKLGQSMYENEFTKDDRKTIEKEKKRLLKQLEIYHFDELMIQLGEGRIQISDLRQIVFNPTADGETKGTKSNTKAPVVIKGLFPGVAVHYAKCCHPLPGDRIVGILTPGKGVTVHLLSCEMLSKYEDDPKKWVNVSWGETVGSRFQSRLDIVLYNKAGSLGSVTTMMGENHADIANIRVTRRQKDFFEFIMDVEVKNLLHLHQLVGLVRSLPTVYSVERV